MRLSKSARLQPVRQLLSGHELGAPFSRLYFHLAKLTMSQSSDSKLTAVELKAEANELFGRKKFGQAAIKYTKAIELDRGNAVLYANRAACHLALKRFVFPHNINFNQTF
jgi:hypothetical protein